MIVHLRLQIIIGVCISGHHLFSLQRTLSFNRWSKYITILEHRVILSGIPIVHFLKDGIYAFTHIHRTRLHLISDIIHSCEWSEDIFTMRIIFIYRTYNCPKITSSCRMVHTWYTYRPRTSAWYASVQIWWNSLCVFYFNFWLFSLDHQAIGFKRVNRSARIFRL